MKYIDADRLRAAIEEKYRTEIWPWLSGVSPKSVIYEHVLPLIDSLKQEQQEKPVPKNLEEAAKECNSNLQLQEYFIKGGMWQKEQMMKEAVEWTVTTNLANRPVIYLDQLKGFQYGDKVRIIIVTED